MFSQNFLIVSLLWGTVGSGLCIYGKKQGAVMPVVVGMAMVGASYFVPSAILMSLISIGLIGGMIWLRRAGY